MRAGKCAPCLFAVVEGKVWSSFLSKAKFGLLFMILLRWVSHRKPPRRARARVPPAWVSHASSPPFLLQDHDDDGDDFEFLDFRSALPNDKGCLEVLPSLV